MRLDGRRESSNVEDRRGMSGGTKAGLGIGGVIIAALIAWISGGDPISAGLEALQNNIESSKNEVDNNLHEIWLFKCGKCGYTIVGKTDPELCEKCKSVQSFQKVKKLGEEQHKQGKTDVGEENFTEEEQALASDCKKILASTEDVWGPVFEQMGGTYTPPTLVLFSNQVNSACGSATAAVGPFYCSGDQKLYIDLSFFTQMKRQLGVEGNTFAYAYVIAHEIGHHVENLTGTLGKAHQAMNQTDKVSANQISVRLELLADYYAGVWAHYEDAMNHSMEYGDLEKGLELAKAIGDDWLQKKAQGRATPESFTHGTSDQRKRWLKRGFETGDMKTSTFSVQNYNDL